MGAGSDARAVDVAVLGAGAAGLMAAAEAGRRGRRVVLLEGGERPGRKILISGGGRCNFTNLHTRVENFVSENPHFARSALARYPPAAFIALVERHGIRYHEKTLGQLFCDDSAQRIVRMLERECAEAGVAIHCGARLLRVERKSQAPRRAFLVQTTNGSWACEAVIVATGGLSIPKLGATGIGYEVARGFGHRIAEPRAALVPLVLAPEDSAAWCDLTGVSVEVVAKLGKQTGAAGRPSAAGTAAFREKLLITHRGLSGPAALQISSYWAPGKPLQFDLAPERQVLMALREQGAPRDRGSLLAAARSVMPARLADRWVARQMLAGADLTNAGLQRLEEALHAWTVIPAGTEGFGKAEVTAGGVDTRELEARTLESRRVPGLFFVGEVVDVTGWLGGYNFQWAWASAVAAGAVA